MIRPPWARWVTRISLVLALVALVFTIHDTGPRQIASYLRRIGWWWLAVALLEVAITTLDAVAIRALLSPEQAQVRLRTTLLAQLAGRAVNAVTPSGNLGEVVKVSMLLEHVSQPRAVSTILLYNAISVAIELLVVAVAVPFVILLVAMPAWVAGVMIITCVVSAAIVLGLFLLVRYGALTLLAPLARALHVGLVRLRPSRRSYVLPAERYARWQRQLRDVADQMRASDGARRRDRALGIGAVVVSRLTSMSLSFLILHALGEAITPGFAAAYIVGGFIIYMTSTLVPMGIGISEGGNYALFRALGEDPTRGVTLVLARRVVQIVYAAIGVVLMTASETVQRARERQAAQVAASAPAVAATLDLVTGPSPSRQGPATKIVD
jgi:uncharacterized protein (TIRG00374 family)